MQPGNHDEPLHEPDPCKPRLEDLAKVVRGILDDAISHQNPSWILGAKALQEDIKPRFLELLEARSRQDLGADVEVILFVLVHALIRRHAANRLRQSAGLFERFCVSSHLHEVADRIADQVYVPVSKHLSRLARMARDQGWTDERAYHTLSKYCRVAAVREADRQKARHARRKARGPRFFSLTRDDSSGGSWSEEREFEPGCPESARGFEGNEFHLAVERWLDAPGCPVTRIAWRKFILRAQLQRPYKEIARIFGTNANAINVNFHRVQKALMDAGFVSDVLDLEMDRILKAELEGEKRRPA